MPENRTHLRTDEECRRVHGLLARNLHRLMSTANAGQGLSVLALARATGLGTGSIQNILRDPDHSPGIRVLDRLAQYFGLRGGWVLLGNLDLDREICFWLATHRLPFAMQEQDIRRLVALCEPWQTAQAASLLLELSREMTLGEFRALLDRAEGLEQPSPSLHPVMPGAIAG